MYRRGGQGTNGAKVFIADFDRCYGKLSNIKVINVPYDSCLCSNDAVWAPEKDSLITGLAFSPNDSFLYIGRRYNIFQYDINSTDTSTQIYQVQRGIDTTNLYSVTYGNLQLAPDGRIYIGFNADCVYNKHSTINYPNKKGIACGMCKQCFGANNYGYCSTAFPNMPNFRLGALGYVCPPLSNYELGITNYEIKVYPNPTTNVLNVELPLKNTTDKIEVFNVVGQKVLSLLAGNMSPSPAGEGIRVRLDISSFSKGLYYIKVGNRVCKFIKE